MTTTTETPTIPELGELDRLTVHTRTDSAIEDGMRSVLESVATIFNDGKRVNVEFSRDASCAVSEDLIRINTDTKHALGKTIPPAQQLRCIVDTVSHEVEHIRESDLDSKREFMAANSDHRDVAGFIRNVVEDVYIDRTRLSRFRGLRRARAFTVNTQMRNGYRRPPMGSIERNQQLIEGFTQVAFAGYAKGFGDADPDVQAFLAWSRGQIAQGKYAESNEERNEISQRIVDAVLALTDDETEVEQYVEQQVEASEDGKGATDPIPPESREEMKMREEFEDEADEEDCEDGPAEGEEGEGSAAGDEEVDDEGGEEGEGSAGSESGPDPETPEDFDPSNFEGDIEEMEEAERSRDSSSWTGVPGGNPVSEMDENEIRRFEELVERIEDAVTDVGRLKEDREEKAGEYASKRRVTAEDVREKLEENGLAEKVEDAFRAIATRDHEYARDFGEDVNLDAYVGHMAGDFGETEVYYHQERAEIGDGVVGVAIDQSGSMGGVWDEKNSKAAIAALAIAAEAIGDEFTGCSFFTDRYRENGMLRHDVQTTLITAPDEDFEYDHLDAIWPHDNEPYGAGIELLESLMDDIPAGRKTMVVITDGCPYVDRHGNSGEDRGRADARIAVQQAREKGYTVIGLTIDQQSREKEMANIFGEDGFINVEMENLTAGLLEVYSAQLEFGEEVFV